MLLTTPFPEPTGTLLTAPSSDPMMETSAVHSTERTPSASLNKLKQNRSNEKDGGSKEKDGGLNYVFITAGIMWAMIILYYCWNGGGFMMGATVFP